MTLETAVDRCAFCTSHRSNASFSYYKHPPLGEGAATLNEHVPRAAWLRYNS